MQIMLKVLLGKLVLFCLIFYFFNGMYVTNELSS